MRIVDRVRADGHRPWRGLDDRVGPHLAGLKRGGDREGFHRRARLEHIGQRSIAHPLACHLVAAIGVVRGPVGQRQDFAGRDIQDHDATGLGLVQLHRSFEFTEREVLQPRIDRQCEIAPGLRGLDRRDVFHGLAAPVDDHAAAAGHPGQPRLLGEFDAFLSRVVVAGETDDMRRNFPARIEAAVFVLVVQAADAQRHYAGRRLRRDLPR